MLLPQPLMGRVRPELATDVRSWLTSMPSVPFYAVGEESIAMLLMPHYAKDVCPFYFN